ncbi:hypothetical protein BAU14_08830 [Enterococcus sp. CU9D]|nr:hypothetical protein BAU14_08830 [Enterococcus sp. CU9D]
MGIKLEGKTRFTAMKISIVLSGIIQPAALFWQLAEASVRQCGTSKKTTNLLYIILHFASGSCVVFKGEFL